MPKSRSRRKKKDGKKRKGSSARSAARVVPPSQNRVNPQPNDHSSVSLLDEKTKGRFRVVLLSPLIIGTFAAIGVTPDRFSPWLLFCVALTLGMSRLAAQSWSKGGRQAQIRVLLFGTVTLIGIGAFFYFGSGNISATTLLIASSLLLGGIELLVVRDVRAGAVFSGSVILLSCLLGLLGVFTQAPSTDIMQLQALIFGFPSGAILAGASVVNFSSHFTEVNWLRYRTVSGRDGKSVNRPGKLGLLYAVLVMILPSLLVGLTPFGIFPPAFMLLVFPTMRSANLCASFVEQRIPDDVLVARTVRLGFVTAGLMLAAALLL